MNSRNIVLGLSALIGFALSTGAMTTGCSSDNNPAPSNTNGNDASTGGQDSASNADVTTGGNDTGTTTTDAGGGGTDSSTVTDSGKPDTGAAACDPTAYASDSGCTPCGTAFLTACPLASLGVICIPFDNTTVPDAGKF